MRGREDDSVDLMKSFSDDSFRRALEDWAWLPVAGKRPFLATLFGDGSLKLPMASGCLRARVLSRRMPNRTTRQRPLRRLARSAHGCPGDRMIGAHGLTVTLPRTVG
jgi:hypothetical protein